jgi:membrane protein implicated in regulation of membrane protease activity
MSLDAIEAATNATVGLCVSVLAVWALWPLFGWDATGAQSVAVTALFWALSTVRAYVLRRVFRRLGNG